MAASVFDSPLHAQLFPGGETTRLFSDSAAVRAMLLVEGALAKAQGAQGIIPEISAAAIQRATMEVQIDPAGLARGVGQNGVVVPGLVAAFRSEMNAPEHAQYVHWGATSQDIMDTGLMLRLRQVLAHAETLLKDILQQMGAQARTHAVLPLIARTYGQHAVPTSWGAVLAGWGMPLCTALEDLGPLRRNNLLVSLSGAAGTASVWGDKTPRLRKDLAEALGLEDPGRCWHTDRTPLLRIVDWLCRLCAPLLAMGETLLQLTSSDVAEVSIGTVGGSSTMPQKQNPVQACALVALARQTTALQAGLTQTAGHAHQRDGAAWLGEWITLPPLVLGAMSCLQIARDIMTDLSPNAAQMQRGLRDGLQLYHAEALSFALTQQMSRPQAQAAVKSLCQQAVATNTTLPDLAHAAYPDVAPTLFDPAHALGQAPAEARQFAAHVKGML